MKKIVYLLMTIIAVGFTSCNPMDDIHNEIDAETEAIVAEGNITLTDEDYDDLGLDFGNFSSEDDAKIMIPSLLSDKFPVWGKGSLANVTFDLYQPKRDERSLIIYEVTTEDYDANPETAQYDNFDDIDQIYDFLNDKYPTPEDRVLVSLTYEFYDGSTNTLNNGFLYLNGTWEFVQGFTEDEYATMGEGFPNFSSEDEAEEKVPVFLLDKFKYDNKEAGDIEAIMYKLYVGGGVTESYVKYFIFDGSNWSVYNNVIAKTIQFGHDGTTWVPDNTIRHMVSSADITIITSALIDKYPGPADNVSFFGSFDRRSSSSNYWTDDMLLEGFNILLDTIHPDAEEGQKYVLTFVTYVGATVNEDMSLIKTGGVWVLN